MLNDPLAATLSKLNNAEKVGKREVVLTIPSNMIKKVLDILNDNRYIGSFQEQKIGNKIILKVNLLGSINKCGVIKPRFSTKRKEFEKWEKRYLPSKDFGIILVSTPKGVMTHLQAKENNLGGKLLAYCY